MSFDALPRPLSPLPVERDTELHTQVFTGLCHLLSGWRDDPDKLAAACAAWSLFGYPACNLAFEVASGYPHPTGYITEGEALKLVESALHGRRRERLRARGWGVLQTLIEFAPAFERDRLHSAQKEGHVIDCRVLPIEERIERLRADEVSA